MTTETKLQRQLRILTDLWEFAYYSEKFMPEEVEVLRELIDELELKEDI